MYYFSTTKCQTQAMRIKHCALHTALVLECTKEHVMRLVAIRLLHLAAKAHKHRIGHQVLISALFFCLSPSLNLTYRTVVVRTYVQQTEKEEIGLHILHHHLFWLRRRWHGR